MKLEINVYEKDLKTVKKVVEANTIEISFGTIRKFMALFNISTLDDTMEIMKVVLKSWNEVVELLDLIFPDMNEEDWDGVKTKELLEVIKDILTFSFKEMLNIPVDSKN